MSDAIVPIGIVGLIVVAVLVIGGSFVWMMGENRNAAAINRKNNLPISNGLVIPAAVTFVIMILIVVIIGFLPPLLRRG